MHNIWQKKEIVAALYAMKITFFFFFFTTLKAEQISKSTELKDK